MGVKIRRNIDTAREIIPDIIIDAEDITVIGEAPLAYAPLSISGPYEVNEGFDGKSILVQDGQTNLLLNSTFELGALTSWTTNNVTASVTTDYSSYKLYSAKLTSTANATTHYIQQQVVGSANTKYVASVWVNMPESGAIGTGSGTKGASLVVREIDGGSAQVGLNETALNAHNTLGWQQLIVSFTTSPTTANIQFRLHVYDAGPVYFDSSQLVLTNANQYTTLLIDGMKGNGYTFSGTRDNSTSIRADNTTYANVTNYDPENGNGITALVWARPLWAYNQNDTARTYSPFALTTDAGVGLTYRYSTSSIFEVTASSTATVIAGDSFRYDAGEQLVFGVTADGSNNTYGFLGKNNTSIYRELVAGEDSCVSYWRMGEVTPLDSINGYYIDVKGSNHLNVTLGGTKYGILKSSGSLGNDSNAGTTILSGYGCSIGRPYTGSLNTSAFSLEFWLRINTHNTSGYPKFFYSSNQSSTGYWLEFSNTSKQLGFYWYGGAGQGGVLSSNLEENKWYHFVATHSGTTGNLYENGRLKATQVKAYAAEASTAFNLVNGLGTGASYTIDECAYYNSALSERQVFKRYSAGVNYMLYKTITNGTCSALSSNTITRFYLGNNSTGNAWFDGYIDGALVFNKVLSDDRIAEYIREGFNSNTDAIVAIDNLVPAAEISSVSVATPSVEGIETYSLAESNTNYKVVWDKVTQ